MKIYFLIMSFLLCANVQGQWVIKHLDVLKGIGQVIKFKNSNIGLSMGSNDYLLKTENAGETWDRIPFDNEIFIQDFQFIGDSSIVAVGFKHKGSNWESKFLKSNNLGETWNTISSFNEQQFRSLHFSNIDTGFIAGSNSIFHTTNGGISWDTVTSVTEFGYEVGDFIGLAFPSKQVGYAIAQGFHQRNGIVINSILLKSEDAGNTWDTLKTFPNYLASIQFVSNDTGFIGGDNSMIYKTQDGGKTWNSKQVTKPIHVINSMHFTSNNTGFISGHPSVFIPEGPLPYFIAKTINGGETWAVLDTIGITINDIHFINDKLGFTNGNLMLIMKSNGVIDELPENYPWYLMEDPDNLEDKIMQEKQVLVFPNPTTGNLSIQNLDISKKITAISLFHASGQRIDIAKPFFNQNTINVNLKGFGTGLFVLKIEYSNKIELIKIIKN